MISYERKRRGKVLYIKFKDFISCHIPIDNGCFIWLLIILIKIELRSNEIFEESTSMRMIDEYACTHFLCIMLYLMMEFCVCECFWGIDR